MWCSAASSSLWVLPGRSQLCAGLGDTCSASAGKPLNRLFHPSLCLWEAQCSGGAIAKFTVAAERQRALVKYLG